MKEKKNFLLKAVAVIMMFILTFSSVNLLNKLSVITGIGTRAVSVYLVVITCAVLILYLLLQRERRQVKKFSDTMKDDYTNIAESKERETESMELKSKFNIIRSTEEYVYIIDCETDGMKSVTNDAENVVSCLSEIYELGERRLIYRDSTGQIDEILHKNGRFSGFAAGYKGITDELEKY